MIVWTSGISVFLFRYIFKDFRADLRFVIIGSFSPVLIDKFLFVFKVTQNPISIGHSLFLTNGLLFVLMIFTKKNTQFRSNALLFTIGSFFYLILSFTWLNQEIFLYPLFIRSEELFQMSTPVKLILNLIGGVYLIFKIKNIKSLKYFLKEGKFT